MVPVYHNRILLGPFIFGNSTENKTILTPLCVNGFKFSFINGKVNIVNLGEKLKLSLEYKYSIDIQIKLSDFHTNDKYKHQWCYFSAKR